MAEPYKRLHPQAYEALSEALATFQWFKNDFTRMIHGLFAARPEVIEGVQGQGPTKREQAREIVRRLQEQETRLQAVTVGALLTLADYDPAFPHLARLDDGPEKVSAAQSALAEVQRMVQRQRSIAEDLEARAEAAAAASLAEVRRRAFDQDLQALRQEFYELASMTNPQARGLALEPLIARLFDLHDLLARGAFSLRGEQIDGAFTFDTDDYLLEIRWRKDRVDPAQLRDFAGKVSEKSHRTSGLMLSIEGFTPAAAQLFRGTGTRVLLMDGGDLVAVLEGVITLDELLFRKRRHVAETGDPYVRAATLISGS